MNCTNKLKCFVMEGLDIPGCCPCRGLGIWCAGLLRSCVNYRPKNFRLLYRIKYHEGETVMTDPCCIRRHCRSMNLFSKFRRTGSTTYCPLLEGDFHHEKAVCSSNLAAYHRLQFFYAHSGRTDKNGCTMTAEQALIIATKPR